MIGVLFSMQMGIATLLGVHGTFPFLACYVFWLPWRGLLDRAPAHRTRSLEARGRHRSRTRT